MRRVIVVGLFALLLGGMGPAARATVPVDEGGLAELDLAAFSFEVALTPDRNLEVGIPTGLLVKKASDGTILETRSLPVSLSSSQGDSAVAATGSFTCINSSGPPGFRIYPVGYATSNTNGWFLQYLYNLYSYDNARTIVGIGKTFQVEECTTGGSSTKMSWRQDITGTGVAWKSQNPKIIGFKWFTGKTPSNISVSLGFKVGTDRPPVSINGSVTVTPQDQNLGSQGLGLLSSAEPS